jgi:hypothetical protein
LGEIYSFDYQYFALSIEVLFELPEKIGTSAESAARLGGKRPKQAK